MKVPGIRVGSKERGGLSLTILLVKKMRKSYNIFRVVFSEI